VTESEVLDAAKEMGLLQEGEDGKLTKGVAGGDERRRHHRRPPGGHIGRGRRTRGGAPAEEIKDDEEAPGPKKGDKEANEAKRQKRTARRTVRQKERRQEQQEEMAATEAMRQADQEANEANQQGGSATKDDEKNKVPPHPEEAGESAAKDAGQELLQKFDFDGNGLLEYRRFVQVIEVIGREADNKSAGPAKKVTIKVPYEPHERLYSLLFDPEKETGVYCPKPGSPEVSEQWKGFFAVFGPSCAYYYFVNIARNILLTFVLNALAPIPFFQAVSALALELVGLSTVTSVPPYTDIMQTRSELEQAVWKFLSYLLPSISFSSILAPGTASDAMQAMAMAVVGINIIHQLTKPLIGLLQAPRLLGFPGLLDLAGLLNDMLVAMIEEYLFADAEDEEAEGGDEEEASGPLEAELSAAAWAAPGLEGNNAAHTKGAARSISTSRSLARYESSGGDTEDKQPVAATGDAKGSTIERPKQPGATLTCNSCGQKPVDSEGAKCLLCSIQTGTGLDSAKPEDDEVRPEDQASPSPFRIRKGSSLDTEKKMERQQTRVFEPNETSHHELDLDLIERPNAPKTNERQKKL